MGRARIFKKELPEPLRLLLLVAVSLLTGVGLSLVNALIGTQSLRRAVAAPWSAPAIAFWATALLLGLLTLILALLTRSLFAGGAAVSAALLAASFVNHFKNAITFTPLQVSDLTLIGKLGEITRLNGASIRFSRNSILAVLAVILWLAVLFLCSRPLRQPWKRSLIGAAASALAFALLFCVPAVADGWIYAPLRSAGYGRPGDRVAAGANDVVLNLWNGVVHSGSAALADPNSPEGRALVADLRGYVEAEDPGGGDASPNVIVILAESFFDLTKLPGVEYDGDPLAEFHRVQEEGVSGAFHTRTLSYGTCAIEMELLSGINSRAFPGDEQLSEWEPDKFDKHAAVPELFREKGYYTAFLHTFNDSIYERGRTYPHLGFDELYFSDRFAEIVPEAAAAEDYWAYMATRVSGGAYSDDLMADALIDLYERERGEHPVFLYGVTMENHTPFTGDKYDRYDYAFTANLDAEAAGVLNAVTQAESNCAKALGKLVDYFARVDEPTVIVFYGDHRPGLGLEKGGSLYTALGMVPETVSDWSVEQIAALYASDYVIWANDPSLLPAPAGTRDRDTSSNFLGLDILRISGVELDDWWRLIASLREDSLAWMWSYYYSADGALAPLPEDVLDAAALRKLEVYRWLVRRAYAADGTDTIYSLLN